MISHIGKILCSLGWLNWLFKDCSSSLVQSGWLVSSVWRDQYCFNIYIIFSGYRDSHDKDDAVFWSSYPIKMNLNSSMMAFYIDTDPRCFFGDFLCSAFHLCWAWQHIIYLNWSIALLNPPKHAPMNKVDAFSMAIWNYGSPILRKLLYRIRWFDHLASRKWSVLVWHVIQGKFCLTTGLNEIFS